MFLPISSWDPTAETVDEFVASRLLREHPKVFHGPRGAELARTLMAPLRIDDSRPPVQHVLPVLDGLDELQTDRIPAAIRKLHEFMAAGRPLVVTCRSREYKLITREQPGELEQAAVVEIQPVALELVYIHGGGFTYGTLDEFESAMRVIAGIATYLVDYQLAPEAKYPVQIEEIEYVVRWLFDHAAEQGVDRRRSRSAATPRAAT